MDSDSEWVVVQLSNGATVRVAKGSAVHAAFSAESQGPTLTHRSFLEERLWQRLPESWPLLRKRQEEAKESAIEHGREMTPETAGIIAPEVLWYPLMKPALLDYPATRDKVTEYLNFVRETYELDCADDTNDAIYFYVLEPLVEYKSIVQDVDPRLFEIMKREIPYLK